MDNRLFKIKFVHSWETHMHIWKQTCGHFWGFGKSINMKSLSIFRCCGCLTSDAISSNKISFP
ncbi:hypothetical protein YC2023_091931 [Brassica napus]